MQQVLCYSCTSEHSLSIYLLLSMPVPVYELWALHVCKILQRSGEDNGGPGIGVTDSCDPLYVLETEVTCPLQKQ